MKYQNCILINFVTDGWTDGRTSPKQYAPSTFPKLGAYQYFKDFCVERPYD